MTVELKCNDCNKKIGETPEIGQARGTAGLAVALLQLHLDKTGHENFSYTANATVLDISLFTTDKGARGVSVLSNKRVKA